MQAQGAPREVSGLAGPINNQYEWGPVWNCDDWGARGGQGADYFGDQLGQLTGDVFATVKVA
eukprot:5224520-Lingulodinium_polyedra.AAC.1